MVGYAAGVWQQYLNFCLSLSVSFEFQISWTLKGFNWHNLTFIWKMENVGQFVGKCFNIIIGHFVHFIFYTCMSASVKGLLIPGAYILTWDKGLGVGNHFWRLFLKIISEDYCFWRFSWRLFLQAQTQVQRRSLGEKRFTKFGLQTHHPTTNFLDTSGAPRRLVFGMQHCLNPNIWEMPKEIG